MHDTCFMGIPHIASFAIQHNKSLHEQLVYIFIMERYDANNSHGYLFSRWFARRRRTHFHCVMNLPSTIHASVIVKALQTCADGSFRGAKSLQYRWAFKFGVGEEMIALGRGGHILAQLDVRIQNMCILTYVWIFFPKPSFFLLHFRCDNSSFFRRLLDQNNRSMYHNQEPKRFRQTDNN